MVNVEHSNPGGACVDIESKLVADFHELFGRAPEVVASAPGRIEIIGNHTDYNGGPVLGASIDQRVCVALALRTDDRRRFASDYQSHGAQIVEVSEGDCGRQTGSNAWTNYPLGVLAALPVFGLRMPLGFDYLAHSNLSVGSGLSSSAAIEVASALAFIEATGQPHTLELVAKIGRHAENHFVGVPCGILDQGVSVFGQLNQLVFVDGMEQTFNTVPLPNVVRFWVFNTHTRHSLIDGLYAERHRECMLAASGLGVSQLAEVNPKSFGELLGRLPEPISRRAKHVIDEIGRVHAVAALLPLGHLQHVGRLLTASHRSSQRLFENSTTELDFLVDTLVTMPHIYGARLTGGGFGGAVLAMTDADFTAEMANGVAGAYQRQFGAKPEVVALSIGRGARVVKSR